MLNRYRDIELCKEDINSFLNFVKKDVGNISESQLRSIAKGIILFKRIFMQKDPAYFHYSECLISDALSLVHACGIKSQRLYYTTYRSLIENFTRVLLEYDNSNDTGVRNMFKELHGQYENGGKDFIDYLEGEYGKCCNVIHSNIKANLQLYSYYEDIVLSDEMNEKTINYCVNALNTFFNKVKEFIIKNIPQLLNDSFYNHRELLAFLIGKENYSKLEKKIN